jgi:hypothetical protein
MNEEHPSTIIADHLLASVHFTTLASHMMLANLVRSPLYLHYKVKNPPDTDIVMAIREGGEAILAAHVGDDDSIHLVELEADAQNFDIERMRHQFSFDVKQDCENAWGRIKEKLNAWCEGAAESVVLEEKDIDTLQQ